MASLLGEVIGRLATLVGWDGTHFRPVHVDADGDLQTDVLSSALPAGAATQLTLAALAGTDAAMSGIITSIYEGVQNAIRAYVVDSVLPDGAATSADQATMITALQLIDDLRTALDSVGTDELRVLAGKTGAAWKALPIAATGELEAKILNSVLPTGAATADNQTTMLGKVTDQVFTFKDYFGLRASEMNVAAGGNTLLGPALEEGYLYVVTGLTGWNAVSIGARSYVGGRYAGSYRRWNQIIPVAIDEACSFQGQAFLAYPDRWVAGFQGCTAGDDLYLDAFGYRMTLGA